MKFLLIDTNCWIDLLTAEVEESILNELEYWIKEGKICLLIPNKLCEEWQEQKETHLKAIKNRHKETIKTVASTSKKILEHDFEKINLKGERIEGLIKKGKHFGPTKSVQAGILVQIDSKICVLAEDINHHDWQRKKYVKQ